MAASFACMIGCTTTASIPGREYGLWSLDLGVTMGALPYTDMKRAIGERWSARKRFVKEDNRVVSFACVYGHRCC